VIDVKKRKKRRKRNERICLYKTVICAYRRIAAGKCFDSCGQRSGKFERGPPIVVGTDFNANFQLEGHGPTNQPQDQKADQKLTGDSMLQSAFIGGLAFFVRVSSQP
jgi:hypothetical protein